MRPSAGVSDEVLDEVTQGPRGQTYRTAGGHAVGPPRLVLLELKPGVLKPMTGTPISTALINRREPDLLRFPQARLEDGIAPRRLAVSRQLQQRFTQATSDTNRAIELTKASLKVTLVGQWRSGSSLRVSQNGSE